MTDGPASKAAASVVIPAHNEATVIDRCLGALARSRNAARLEVVVVANGCVDETVERAETWLTQLPMLTVLDLPAASKAAALNAGDESASIFPRIYLDADIELADGSIDEVLAALAREEPHVASPQVCFDRSGANRLVNLFYDSYEQTPYVRRGLVGLGVYAMNESGRARFGRFPALMADDLLVQLHFAEHERTVVPSTFTVRVPRSVRDLVRVRTRIARGNADLVRSTEIADSPTAPTPTGSTVRAVMRGARTHPASAFVYLTVVSIARALALRHREGTWLRDTSTRASNAAQRETLRVAYLVSQYPAPSHTFIEREILALEQRGAAVCRISIRPTPPELLLSDVMRAEAALTTVVQDDPRAVLRAVLAAAARHPIAFGRAAVRSLRTGPSGIRSRVWQVFYLAEAFRVRAIMKTAGVTHLHAHFANNSADIARHVSAFSREVDGPDAVTWTFTMHGPTEFENVERFDLAAKAAAADGVACITDFARSQLMRLTETDVWPRLWVVPMSVDIEAFYPSATRTEANYLRVLFIGRMVPEKGPLVLVDALSLAERSGVELEARFVGEGPLREATRQAILLKALSDRVSVLGALGQDEIRELFHWADVLCLPSFQEGLPVVLMEALASEVPVITTPIAGIPELIADSTTGLLVTPGRADHLAEAIKRLAKNPRLRAELAGRGRERVVERHAMTTAGARQEAFLRAAAGHQLALGAAATYSSPVAPSSSSSAPPR